MNTRILSLLAVALIVASASAQRTNQPTSSLVINNVNDAPPNHVWLTPPTTLSIVVGGNPNMPFVLASAPQLSIDEVVYSPTIAVDIGPFASLQVLMDGTASPLVNPFNMFANTGFSGTSTLSLTLPPGASIGTHAALQAFVIDFTIPGFVGCTAATEIGIGDPLGTIAVLSDGPVGSGDGFFNSTNGAALALSDTVVHPQEIALTNFGELYANENASPIDRSPGSIHRFSAPTAATPIWCGGDFQKPFVRTIDGDVYLVQIGATQSYAFMRVNGTTHQIIPGTTFTTNLTGQPAWEKWVHVNGSTMAAVLDGHGLANDRLFLIKLDGIPFAANNAIVREITPTTTVPDDIRSESLVMVGGVVYVAGRVPPSANIASALYRCNMSGSVVATSIGLPLIQNNPNISATRIVPEFRLAPDGNSFFYKSGNDLDTIGRIHQVYQVTATTQTFRVVSFFSAPQPAIRDLGRVSDGTTNRFAVNPGVTRVAFVTFDPATGAEELYNGPITGGITSQVTTNARMDAAIDTIVDPHVVDASTIYFFAGTNDQATDLYRFSTSNLALSNLTKTNGVTATTLPLPSSPASLIDPKGVFQAGGHFYFVRGGTAGAGALTGSAVSNLVGVNVSTSDVYDITGDEFDGIVNPTMTTAPKATELFIDDTANVCWFAGNAIFQSAPRLYSFTPGVAGVAAQSVGAATVGPFNPTIRVLAPDVLGSCTAVLQNADALGADRIVRASAGGAAQTIVDESNGARIRAKAAFPVGSGVQGYWFTATLLAAGSQETVAFFDELSSTFHVLAGPPTLSNTQILGTSYP